MRYVNRQPRFWVLAPLCAALFTGCAFQGEPAVGVWEVASPDEVGAWSTTLDLEVTRLECASGRTGAVLEPHVDYEKERIVIRTDVEGLPPGGYNCQGNDRVPVTVQLTEPIGERELVDAACLTGDAVDTNFCQDDGVRWRP